LIQWTWRTDNNGGELVNALWKLMQQEAALSKADPTHVDQFKRLFGNTGFLVTRQKLTEDGQLEPIPMKLEKKKKKTDPDKWVPDPGPVVMYWWDPAQNKYLTAQEFKQLLKDTHKIDLKEAPKKAQRQLQEELRQRTQSKQTQLTQKQREKRLKELIKQFSNSWISILRPFQDAGADPNFQKFQLLEFINRFNSLLNQRTEDPTQKEQEKATKTRRWRNLGPKISEWVTDDELLAQLLQLSLNRPNNVTNPDHGKDTFDDFGSAVREFVRTHPKAGPPADWTATDRADYEAELSRLLLKMEERKGHVTDAEKRWNDVHDYYQKLKDQAAKAAKKPT
jgi:hypothetical protein